VDEQAMTAKTSRYVITKRDAVMLGAAALIIVTIAVLSYREWTRYHGANADTALASEIQDSADRLLSNLLDAETGQRGFLLTGQERYLEPYNRAIQVIPNEVSNLNKRLSQRPGQPENLAKLNALVNRRVAELGQTIEVRRTQGAAPALEIVLSDRGKRTMDEIRGICSQIQRRESAARSEASLDREAAAQTALLAAIFGSLILLFFFAARLEPVMNRDPQAKRRSWPLVYGAAAVAVVVATLLRMALTPLIGDTAVPFITFFPAVLFAAWFGGFRAGALSILLSALAADYYFIVPLKSFAMPNSGDQAALLLFILVGFGIALLSHSQKRVLEWAERESAQRKHVEQVEREQRQRIETTLASIGDAVISTDAEGRVVFANKVALSLLRAPEADVVGKPLDDVFRIVNEFTRAKVESPVAKVLREGAIVGLANHTVLIALDEAEIPIDDSAAPIRGESGSVQGTVLVFRDITARRQAEATGRLLASIVESSDEGIVSKDLNGVVTSWNKGAERIFGYSAGEMIGRPISTIAAPGRVDEIPDILERIKKGERIDQYETVRRTKSGTLVSVSVTVSPLRDAIGQIVGASKIVRDITEQKQAEERFRQAVEAAPNGMVVSNEDGQIVLVNAQAERMFGYRREEMIGLPVEILVPRRLRDEHPRYRQSFYADPRARLMGEGRDLHGRRKDGREFPVEIGLNPMDTSGGRWVLSAIVDITERKRNERERIDSLATERALASEKALREAEAELARAVRALTAGELAASIAHEVNQPLAAVVTNAEACLRWLGGETPDIQEARESLALIVRDGNRAAAVIRHIREALKKDTKQMASLDINEVAQEAIDLARAELVRNDVMVRVDLSAGLPPVRGDRIQLQQVILNLIMNGSEAMTLVADGSRELLITSRKHAGDSILVAVRDSGAGIKPEDMRRMFEPFFTTKPMGMGMGLSICRSVVEAHGGQIRAAQNDGRGLTVQFSLPVESESPR
jgi:PAS domain S-box-containing protein